MSYFTVSGKKRTPERRLNELFFYVFFHINFFMISSSHVVVLHKSEQVHGRWKALKK